MNVLNFEPQDEYSAFDQEISNVLDSKIQSFTIESCRREQSPYFHTSMQEFSNVKDEYDLWVKSLPSNSGKLFGVSETFPYPVISIKVNFMDLSEIKLEENW